MRISQEFVDTRIDTLLVDMSKGTAPSTRPSQFRCSGLPFCPIRAFLGMDKSDESFSMGFYTSIGTAVHELIQTWITRGSLADRVFARWKCSECSSITGPSFRPDHCPDCGCLHPAFKYEEVEIEYRGPAGRNRDFEQPLSGHVDLIYEIAPRRFVVVDFKTTNLTRAQQRGDWRNQYPASPSSITQISTYCMLLREVYGLNIVAWSLVYVDRGQVITNPSSYHKVTRPWGRRKHDHYRRLVDRACSHAETLEQLRAAIAAADGHSPNAERALKTMVRERPCVSDETYDEWMRAKFHRFSKTERECKFKAQCLRGSRPIYNAVLRKLSS